MFRYFTPIQVGIIAAITALVGIGAYLLWPRTPVAVLPDSPNTTTMTVVTAAPTTTKPKVVPVVDEETDTGPPTASEVEGSVVTTAPTGNDTTTVTTRPDTGTTTDTTTAPVVPLGEPPTFDVITPTHVWPEHPGAAIGNPARRAVLVWDSVRAFWEWYLVEGHPQGVDFDAATRPELSETAAEQINWVHHRFWTEVLPRWDRVWNDEFAKEREQQREWLMIAFSEQYVYDRPGDGIDVRYWGPHGYTNVLDDVTDEGIRAKFAMLPLVDLDGVKQRMAARGYDLDAKANRFSEEVLAEADAQGWDVDPDERLRAEGGFTAEWLAQIVDSYRLPSTEFPLDWLDSDLDVWREWAASVDIESVLGPQAAGGKLGPNEGEMWYQWYPEGLDVGSVWEDYPPFGDEPGGTNPADVFGWYPNWWPERLEVPVHDPAQAGVAGTIAPQNPDTGNYYFEVCLWASGGLFGPWSLPHPEMPDASANTTWWITGLADPSGTIVEISRPRNRPCLLDPARWFYEREWEKIWNETALVDASWSTAIIHGPWDGGETLHTWDRAYVDMLARPRLGSWMWRENPNPNSPRHEALGWDPPHHYTEAPETLGVMIHPLYIWSPDGNPVGYPSGDIRFPWKWWTVVPARDVPEKSRNWRISIGGCHQTGEPYLWMESHTTATPGITTDGGPVWAWPGVIEGSTTLNIATRWQREAGAEFEAEHGSLFRAGVPDSWGYHLLMSEYHPPVPCQNILDGKYEPDAVDYAVTFERYETWMPAVGDKPPTGWTDPHDPFTN